jgi:N-acetylglucosaminyldiphosphoundecaprenol N-acetyl-beta-D-mannosaminyltransferase
MGERFVDAENTQTHSSTHERIKLLKIPLDIVPPEQLPDIIYDLLKPQAAPLPQAGMPQEPGDQPLQSPLVPPAPAPSPEGDGKNIILLSLWDLLRARRNKEYRAFVTKAALVIPISKSMVSGARFLTGKTPYRYMPFNFVVSLLSILEGREYTAYLLGSSVKVLKKTEKNIKETCPQLRIIGRFVGSFRRHDEQGIMEAIRKAAPHLLLEGKGVRGGELWIARNNLRLSRGLRLWCSDIFDVFAEKKKRPSESAFEHGLESVGYCFRNPFKFFRFFPYMRYKFLLVIYKIFNLS